MATAEAYETRLMEPLLRPLQAAELLGVSRRTLTRLVAAGELHPVRVGGSPRFVPQDLRDLVQRGGSP